MSNSDSKRCERAGHDSLSYLQALHIVALSPGISLRLLQDLAPEGHVKGVARRHHGVEVNEGACLFQLMRSLQCLLPARNGKLYSALGKPQ